MAADRLLLADGSSNLLLADGASVLLLTTESGSTPDVDPYPYRFTTRLDARRSTSLDARFTTHLDARRHTRI